MRKGKKMRELTCSELQAVSGGGLKDNVYNIGKIAVGCGAIVALSVTVAPELTIFALMVGFHFGMPIVAGAILIGSVYAIGSGLIGLATNPNHSEQ